MDFKLFGWITPNFKNRNSMLFNNDAKVVLKTIPCESVNLFVSDIPYRISSKGNGIKKEGKKYMGRNV